MRWVQVEDGLSLRFPARDAAFHEGVELGILAALLNAGHGRLTHIMLRRISTRRARSPPRWATA